MPPPTTTTRARSGSGVIFAPHGERTVGPRVGLHEAAAPALGRLHLIERVDVEPGDAVVGVPDEGRDVRDEVIRPVAAPPHQPRDEAPVLREVADGVSDPDA